MENKLSGVTSPVTDRINADGQIRRLTASFTQPVNGEMLLFESTELCRCFESECRLTKVFVFVSDTAKSGGRRWLHYGEN